MSISFRICQKRKTIRFLAAIATLLASMLAMTSISYAETKKLQVPRIDSPPVIDGRLDDPCWQSAVKGDGFTIHENKKPATEQTEFFVCYDENNLYFGFHCFDSQPDKIVASMTERDSGLWDDDFVGVSLDTYHEHLMVDEFYVNAIGTQDDYRAQGTAEKIEWKGDWRAAAVKVSDGWTAEMEIPFSILNYKTGATSMGLNIERQEQRLGESTDWIPFDDGSELTEYGDLEGLELPKRKQEPAIIMPYALARFDKESSKGKMGFDMKYKFGDDDTLLLTVNPDFGYIERAVKSIDFSYTAHRYSENRPFFQEASRIFSSGHLNTTLIPDFNLGMKIFGRQDKLGYGLMGCLGRKNRIDSMITASYDFTPDAYASLEIISRDDKVTNNKVIAFSYGNEIFRNASVWVADAKSITSGAEKNGNYHVTGFSYSNNKWWLYGSYERFSRFFNPATTYLDYPGHNVWDFGMGYGTERPGKSLREYDFSFDASRLWDGDHGLIDRSTYVSGSLDYANHTSWYVSHYWGPHIANYDAEPGTEYYWNNDSNSNIYFYFNTDDRYRSGSVSYNWGTIGGGPTRTFRIYNGFHPTRKLSSSITLKHAKRSNPEEGSISMWQGILGLKYEISPEKSLNARLVRQEDGTNLTLSYRQQVRKGMDIYALFGDYNADHTVNKFSIKLVMTI